MFAMCQGESSDCLWSGVFTDHCCPGRALSCQVERPDTGIYQAKGKLATQLPRALARGSLIIGIRALHGFVAGSGFVWARGEAWRKGRIFRVGK
jgi:hypothetical protein